MENDLIRRSDVEAAIIEDSYGRYCPPEPVDPYSWALSFVKDAPAVDAVEVRHGRWEGNYPQAMFRLKRCSVCETLAPEGWYCFFCGARMDGEDGDT